jgi:hypothetical protein
VGRLFALRDGFQKAVLVVAHSRWQVKMTPFTTGRVSAGSRAYEPAMPIRQAALNNKVTVYRFMEFSDIILDLKVLVIIKRWTLPILFDKVDCVCAINVEEGLGVMPRSDPRSGAWISSD